MGKPPARSARVRVAPPLSEERRGEIQVLIVQVPIVPVPGGVPRGAVGPGVEKHIVGMGEGPTGSGGVGVLDFHHVVTRVVEASRLMIIIAPAGGGRIVRQEGIPNREIAVAQIKAAGPFGGIIVCKRCNERESQIHWKGKPRLLPYPSSPVPETVLPVKVM